MTLALWIAVPLIAPAIVMIGMGIPVKSQWVMLRAAEARRLSRRL